jgi:hypothetical protein
MPRGLTSKMISMPRGAIMKTVPNTRPGARPYEIFNHHNASGQTANQRGAIVYNLDRAMSTGRLLQRTPKNMNLHRNRIT